MKGKKLLFMFAGMIISAVCLVWLTSQEAEATWVWQDDNVIRLNTTAEIVTYSSDTIVDGPDLTGVWTSLTHTCKKSKCTIKGKLSIQNIGNRASGSSLVKLYLSDDNVYDEGDMLIKQILAGKLKAGKSQKKSFSSTLPVGATAYGQYIIAVIDANNTVSEIIETNNNVLYGPIGGKFTIAEYFPLAQGDTWTYREEDGELTTPIISGTESINGVNAAKMIDEDGDYQLHTNSNGITWYKTYDADDLAGCGWSQSVFTPPITITPAEVSIGAKYTSNFTTNYSNCRGESKTTSSSTEWTIEGIEDVTVTAGTFKDCLKLKIKFNNIFSDEGQIQSSEATMWLAKGVGKVKWINNSGYTRYLINAIVGGVSYP